MKKIGIMGGTFDPIHVGHLMIAEAVWDEFKLDKVIFIPSANPPHKHSVMTSAKHRFNMTLLATCSNPHFEVSSIEMERSGPSYTIDTIKHLNLSMVKILIFILLSVLIVSMIYLHGIKLMNYWQVANSLLQNDQAIL